jgi:hypothetical protein
MSVWLPVGRELSPEGWHERLVALVRGQARARVELGRLVDEFARRSGHHEHGFSSLRAWALQRTGLSPRFVEESRSMARRLFGTPGLPLLAQALCQGHVSWSAAARVVPALMQCARVAPERLVSEEQAAVDAARSLTVRKLERWLAARAREWTESDPNLAESPAESGSEPGSERDVEPEAPWAREADADADTEDQPPPMLLLERTVDSTERELIEATRKLITLMDGQVSDEHFVEALLAEAHGAMADGGEAMAFALQREASHYDWAAAHGNVIEAHRKAWRRSAEAAAEVTETRVARWRAQRTAGRGTAETSSRDVDLEPVVWDELGTLSLVELEARALVCSRRQREHDLMVADVALPFARERGWRRLGWRSQDEYAEEELGLSASSLRAIIARARTMSELPELRDAVSEGRLGLEAAAAIGRVATRDTVEAWIERAERRTVLHLREEVRATELLARCDPSTELATDMGPPTAAQLEAVRAFERSVASGAWFEDLLASASADGHAGERERDRQMWGGSSRDADAAGSADAREHADRQMCGGPALDPGRRATPLRGSLLFSGPVTRRDDRLRLRISDEQAGWWRYLERAYAAHERRLARRGAEPMSFVVFACTAVWISWYPTIQQTSQYDRWTEVYVRDRYQCSSPVCSRRDVTPHHLRFQAHGGGDEAANVAALCSWCHLDGIHGGRITAQPPASQIHWRLGRGRGALEVRGRELLG